MKPFKVTLRGNGGVRLATGGNYMLFDADELEQLISDLTECRANAQGRKRDNRIDVP